MITEGAGIVAPCALEFRLQQSEAQELYRVAESRHLFRNYSGRPDVWGKGLITRGRVVDIVGCEVKPGVLPILIGLVGEYATAVSINRAMGRSQAIVDLSLLLNGDGGRDFRVFGFDIDIKTRQRDYGRNLVRRTSGNRLLPLKSNAYLFCEWPLSSTVKIVGWEHRHKIEQWDIEDGLRGEHTNYAAPDCSLLPFSRLIDELKVRKELGSL